MIRKVTVEDSKEISVISSEDLRYECDIELVKSRIEELDDTREMVFVALHNEKLVGYVHAEIYNVLYFESMVNVLGLAVKEECRHMGYGRKLMEAVEQWAKDNEIRYIRVNSGSAREGAHKFYQSIGYDSVKDQKRFLKQI